jgi:uncharacterized protein YxeA
MKTLILTVLLGLISTAGFTQVNPNYHRVKPYYKKDGTRVREHYRTNPNGSNRDNYTTSPNSNPHTGKKGTITPDSKPYSTGRKRY